MKILIECNCGYKGEPVIVNEQGAEGYEWVHSVYVECPECKADKKIISI